MRAYHEIRASYDADTIVVYQAFNSAIADAALHAQRFVAPFSFTRMTWVKPSFLWMMYRCGWSRKDDNQARVLAVRLRRNGFESLLRDAWVCHEPRARDTGAGATAAAAAATAAAAASKADYPCRIQWDPERDLHFAALPYRSLQLGLRGATLQRYVDECIVSITDVTELALRIEALVRAGNDDEAAALLPVERPYPIDDVALARHIRLTSVDADAGVAGPTASTAAQPT